MIRFYKIFYNITIVLLLIHISSASIMNSRFIPLTIGLILIFFTFVQQHNFSRSFLLLVILWFLINLIAIFYFGTGFFIFRLIIQTINLLFLPYVLIKHMGMFFWQKMEKIIFILVAISIPLFILNVNFVNFFNGFTSLFSPITAPTLAQNPNYWTSFIYVNAIFDPEYNLHRNCGFMWEPGAFALIIIWAMIYNFLTTGKKFNFKTIVYISALVTTFSTAGYFALFIVVGAFYLKRITVINFVFFPLLIAIFSLYVYQLEFISGKLNKYNETYSEHKLITSGEDEYIKVNRFLGAYYAMKKVAAFPLGYGLVSKKDYTSEIEIYGTNGLGSLMVMWGIPLFIYLLILMRKYLSLINVSENNLLTLGLLFIALLIMLFSNPISRNLFVYYIIVTPLVFKQRVKIENPVVENFKNKN